MVDAVGGLPAVVRVTVVYSAGPRQMQERLLALEPGTTVLVALRQLMAAEPVGGFNWPEPTQAEIGVWGRKALPSQVLRDGDRLEIYRPLKVDPKVARRERFSQQGARATGLFAKRRPGAKPGY
jgi:putative ubiquitin-RnfH superfamily antitoxin RatB of RatAB toxin-antitoxin module